MTSEPEGQPDVIPIHALFAADGINPNPEHADEIRQALHDAEVIFGVDVMSQHEFLVYGRHVPQQVLDTGQERDVHVLRIGLDMETDELERLVALVRVVKGHDDYRAFEGGA
jgi:hypothetical protein